MGEAQSMYMMAVFRVSNRTCVVLHGVERMFIEPPHAYIENMRARS